MKGTGFECLSTLGVELHITPSSTSGSKTVYFLKNLIFFLIATDDEL